MTMRSIPWPRATPAEPGRCSAARRPLAASALVAALTTLYSTSPPIAAQSPSKTAEPRPPSSDRGLAIARTICKGCHLIDGDDTGPRVVGIPTMRAIANKPGQTARQIENVLILPHAPMPDVQPTAEEIQDIIAYLDTLRDGAATPLLPPELKLEPPRFPRRA